MGRFMQRDGVGRGMAHAHPSSGRRDWGRVPVDVPLSCAPQMRRAQAVCRGPSPGLGEHCAAGDSGGGGRRRHGFRGGWATAVPVEGLGT